MRNKGTRLKNIKGPHTKFEHSSKGQCFFFNKKELDNNRYVVEKVNISLIQGFPNFLHKPCFEEINKYTFMFCYLK